MSASHLVKIGLMGVVGRFDSSDFSIFERDTPVICRTERGLEYGEILCHVESNSIDRHPVDGKILRPVSREDRLILDRLDRHRDKAFVACQKIIDERKIPSVLVDVEHLFDGESVFFYFLGDVDPELESLTDELGQTYEQKVRFKRFAETLANGCGPNCGQGESNCSTGGCSNCGLKGKCGS